MVSVYLCCGRGTGVSGPGWVGFDVEDGGFRPFVRADVRTLDGIRFKDADLIFATPPCSGFTDLPWRPATDEGLDLVEACLRIASEAGGVPFILESNRFLQNWIGPSVCHRGPHHFWGDVGLLPLFRHYKGGTSGKDPLRRAALPQLRMEGA